VAGPPRLADYGKTPPAPSGAGPDKLAGPRPQAPHPAPPRDALGPAPGPFEKVIGELDAAIAAQLRAMRRPSGLPPLPPRVRVRGRKPHDPRFDVREALYYATGVDLTAIEGIDEVHALTLVSELGTDFTRWPTVKQFTCWLGLCSNWQKTGGKVKLS
jgi:hypothetical protein